MRWNPDAGVCRARSVARARSPLARAHRFLARASRRFVPHGSALLMAGILLHLLPGPSDSAQPSRTPVDAPPSQSVLVKFRADSGVRVHEGGVIVTSPGRVGTWSAFAAAHPELRITRLYSRSFDEIEAERERLRSRRAGPIADLNAWGRVFLATTGGSGNPPDPRALSNLAWELSALPEVEYAAPEPRVVDAGLDPVATVARGPRERGAPGMAEGEDESTPDFTVLQGYLGPAPYGIGARLAWAYPGGNGEGVTLVDIETGFNWLHEDLRPPFYAGGPPVVTHHGCAVSGVLIGQRNQYGVEGIVPGLRMGSQSHRESAYVDAMDRAIARLERGDILLIEGQAYGPDGFVPVEYDLAVYERIHLASTSGIICIEAAGNGAVDLDDPLYGGLFDRGQRNSGAIVVGASRPIVGDAVIFSNYGSRVDLNGWGIDVATTGYGNLFGRGDSLRAYTGDFNGTSSAAAVVAGAAASLQGAYRAATGSSLAPATLTRILRDTGSPAAGTRDVGPRPDLARAIPAALESVGYVRVHVHSTDAARPSIDPRVEVRELGPFSGLDADGFTEVAVPAGTWTLAVSDFGFEPSESVVTVRAGEASAVTVALRPRPARQVRGRVLDGRGGRLSGVTVSLEPSPLPPVATRFDGAFSFAEVPTDWIGIVRADLAGHAADATTVGSSEHGEVLLQMARAETFEGSDAGFVSTGEWQWGVPSVPHVEMRAFSGERCWGTRLDGAYTSDIDHVLTTLSYDLTDARAPRLSFRYWLDVWGLSGVKVEIMPFGTLLPEVIEPLGVQHTPCIGSTRPSECTPGFSGNSGGWRAAVFDLSPYIGGTARFRFCVRALDRSANGPGWYIDDVSVHDLVGFSAGFSPDDPYRAILGPNPMREELRVSMDLPRASRVRFEVHDVLGRRIHLDDLGMHASGNLGLLWNGRDDRGHRVPGGVYWIRVLTDPLGVDHPRGVDGSSDARGAIGDGSASGSLREAFRAKVMVVR